MDLHLLEEAAGVKRLAVGAVLTPVVPRRLLFEVIPIVIVILIPLRRLTGHREQEGRRSGQQESQRTERRLLHSENIARAFAE